MEEILLDRINNLILPCCEESGVELVDLDVRRFSGQVAIEILVDKHQGGVTIGECSGLNRKIGEALEAANLIPEDYTLEVSSPGVDRPLKTRKDFVRAVGREIRVFLSEPVAERLEHEGVIEEVQEENVVIENDDGLISLPISKINKAKQIILGRIRSHGK